MVFFVKIKMILGKINVVLYLFGMKKYKKQVDEWMSQYNTVYFNPLEMIV